ncbi:MAG: hypothetical protein R3B09_07090 [Nannocystaceae bacterium]
MKTLRALYRGLEALYAADTGIDPADHVHLFRAGEGRGRELLVIREEEGGDLEVALALDAASLERLEAGGAARALDDAALGDALPVIEGLSHLLYLAEAARRERRISGLELETQAEVDKLALCLLHRHGRAHQEFAGLCERLFHRFTLASDLSPELRERYEAANRLALAFARRMEGAVREGRWSWVRRALQRFWIGDLGEKIAMGR